MSTHDFLLIGWREIWRTVKPVRVDPERATSIGADELHSRLEWALRDHPLALWLARQRYRNFCIRTLAEIERAE